MPGWKSLSLLSNRDHSKSSSHTGRDSESERTGAAGDISYVLDQSNVFFGFDDSMGKTVVDSSHEPVTIEASDLGKDVRKGRYVEPFVKAIWLARGMDDGQQRKVICKNNFDPLKGYARSAQLPEAVKTARSNLVAEVTIDRMRAMLTTVGRAEAHSDNLTNDWCLEDIDLEDMLQRLMTEKGASQEKGGVVSG